MKQFLKGKAVYASALAAVALLYLGIYFLYNFFGEENRRKELQGALSAITSSIESEYFLKMSSAAERVALNVHVRGLAENYNINNNAKAAEYMETIRDYVGADIIYLMDRKGDVKLSTSHDGYDLTGQNYAFRPYFKSAIGGTPHVYAAMGVTTNRSGYYFSFPVKSEKGAIEGVIVIKSGLEEIQKLIDSYDIKIALISPEGIVFQANRASWVLNPFFELEQETIKKIKESRQFGSGPFEPLTSASKIVSGRNKIEGADYYAEYRPFAMKGWRIAACENAQIKYPVSDFENITLISVTAVMTFILVAVIILVYDRQNRERLLASERAYREVFNSVNDAIFIHDINSFEVLDVNDKMLEMYRCKKEDIIKALPSVFSSEEYPMEKAAGHLKLAAAGRPQVFEWKAKRGDNTEISVEVNLRKAVIGGHDRIIAVVRDISERKAAQEQLAKSLQELKRSNQELESYAYITSHDLKEPLRMVSGYLQLLERRYADKLDENAREFIKYAVEGASNMNDLINDLLSLSRISTKAAEFEKVDLARVIENVKTNLKFKIEEAGAEIKSGPLPSVMAEPSQMQQLLQNLTANALKFRSKEKPVIEINSIAEGGFHKISVKDNGIGIEKEYFKKIFVIFQRLHSKVEYPGTGIGLAICQKIVERHGGKIWVESEPGSGSVFYFTLPAAL